MNIRGNYLVDLVEVIGAKVLRRWRACAGAVQSAVLCDGALVDGQVDTPEKSNFKSHP